MHSRSDTNNRCDGLTQLCRLPGYFSQGRHEPLIVRPAANGETDMLRVRRKNAGVDSPVEQTLIYFRCRTVQVDPDKSRLRRHAVKA